MPMYLQLDPRQGKQVFGPFEGMITLGTHPAQCQVVVQAPGIQPFHAQLWPTGPGQFGLQPVERGLKVFMVPRGRHDELPVTTAVSLGVGDSIVLGSPAGPRFQVLDQAPATVPTGAVGQLAQTARQNAYANAFGREVERQVTSRLIAKNPMFREAYQLWYRYRSGAMMSPRVIIPAVLAGLGVLATFAATCGGVGLAFLSRFF